MLGALYELALAGEPCWLRRRGGDRTQLPVHNWLGGDDADHGFDAAIVGLCRGKTLDLGCGPGRLVSQLIDRGLPALGIDQSEAAVELARRNGAPALRADLFDALPDAGHWQTVLLADGNIGVGADPPRILARAAELLADGGRCVVEFDAGVSGVRIEWLRLESAHSADPWFRWASVGIDCAARLAAGAGLTLSAIHRIGERVVATLERS